MTRRDSLADLIASAGNADWTWFDRVEERFAAAGRRADAGDDQRQAIDEAYARIFDSEDGRLVLADMVAGTLDRLTFVTQLGVDPMQAVLYGAFREGQNALVVEIMRHMARGRPGQVPEVGAREA